MSVNGGDAGGGGVGRAINSQQFGPNGVFFGSQSTNLQSLLDRKSQIQSVGASAQCRCFFLS